MKTMPKDFSVDVSQNIDYLMWDKNLTRCGESTIFQTSLWARVYSEYSNDIPIFISVRDKNDNMVGQLLLFILNKDTYEPGYYNLALRFASSKLGIGTRLIWNYGPIIQNKTHAGDILRSILCAIDRIAKEWNATLVVGSSPPLDNTIHEYMDVYTTNFYKIDKWGTFIVNVAQPDEIIWKSLDKKARNDVRRAEKRFVIKEITDDDLLIKYALLAAKFNRSKKGIISSEKNLISWFRIHWKCMRESNIQGKFFLAYKDEQPIAGLRVYSFNGNVTQHDVLGESSEGNLGGPLLTWHAIKWANSSGSKTFDFAGVNPSPSNQKERAIYFYKSKWGGDLQTYYRFIKIVKPAKVKLFSALSYSDKLKRFIVSSLAR